MTIAFVATSSAYTTTATGVRGTTSINVAYPGSGAVALGRMAVIFAEGKLSTATWGADPSGFTKLVDTTGGNATNGVDNGPTRVGVWYRILDGTETGNATIALTGGTQVTATMSIYSNTVGEWAPPIAVTGGDATQTTNVSFTGGAWASTLAANDMVLIGYAYNTDATGSHSALSLTQSGATFGTVTGRSRLGGSDGNDGTIITWEASVTTGTANAPTFSTTFATASSGIGVFVRLREQTLTARTPPTLIAFDQTASWQATTTPQNIGSSLTWVTGDVIVVVGVSEDTGITLSTPTATGLTFNPIGSANAVGNSTGMHRWVAIAASGGSGIVSIARGASSGRFGAGVWQYRGSDGIGTAPAIVATTNVKIIPLIESQNESAVINVIGDWAAGSTASPTWTPSGETQRIASDGAGVSYSVMGADWADANLATSTDYGLTAGLSTGMLAKAVIEVLGTAGGGATEHFGAAAFSIESSLTTSGTVTKFGSSALSAQSNVTTAGTATVFGSVTMTIQSGMTSAGARVVNGSAALSIQSNLSASGLPSVAGSSVMSIQSNMTVSGTVTVRGAAALSVQSSMATIGSNRVFGSTTPSIQSNVTAAGTVTRVGATAALSVQSNLAASGFATTTGMAALSSSLVMTTAGIVGALPTTASLSFNSNLTASGMVTVRAASVLSGQSNLTATGQNTVRAVTALSAQANMVTAGRVSTQGIAALSAQSNMTVVGTTNTTPPSATLSSQFSMTVTGSVIVRGSAILSINSNIDSNGRATVRGVAPLSVQSSIAVIGTRVVYGAAGLSAQSNLSADGFIPAVVTGSVQLSIQFNMEVEGNSQPPWVFPFIEFGSTTAVSNRLPERSIVTTEASTTITVWEGG
jgi:hypothetical protein